MDAAQGSLHALCAGVAVPAPGLRNHAAHAVGEVGQRRAAGEVLGDERIDDGAVGVGEVRILIVDDHGHGADGHEVGLLARQRALHLEVVARSEVVGAGVAHMPVEPHLGLDVANLRSREAHGGVNNGQVLDHGGYVVDFILVGVFVTRHDAEIVVRHGGIEIDGAVVLIGRNVIPYGDAVGIDVLIAQGRDFFGSNEPWQLHHARLAVGHGGHGHLWVDDLRCVGHGDFHVAEARHLLLGA